MAYKLATAFVDIHARMNTLGAQFNQVRGMAEGLLGKINALGGAFGLTLGIASLASASRYFIGAAGESYDAAARLDAILRATGNAAGFTAEEISELAVAMQSRTTFGDEAITNAASKLLTFKSIVGDTFKETLSLSADLAATGFGSIDSAAIQLGKALEDPIRGMGALRRVGVSFSEEQKEQIKGLVQANQLLKAQGIILEAVRGQVGGVAEERAKTPKGQLDQIQELIGDIGEEFGKRLFPIAIELGKVFLAWSKYILGLVDGFIALNNALGGLLTPIVPIYNALKAFLALPAISEAMTRGYEKLQYAFGRIVQAVDGARQVVLRIATDILAKWGLTWDGMLDSIVAFTTKAIDLFAEFAADMAEWTLVVVDHWERMVRAIKSLNVFELRRIVESMIARKGELEKERVKLAVEAAKALAPPPTSPGRTEMLVTPGLTGLQESWSQLQEALLKRSSPEEQMVGLLEDGVDIANAQLEMLVGIKQAVAAGAVA